ncbi:MAG: hypothetical protein ABSA34_00370 [Candidatus Goldiibacteriota bacterium]|jgi:hypothetical protein
MDDALTFIVPAAFFFILNRGNPGLKKFPSRNPAIISALFIILSAAALVLKYSAPGQLVWFFPAAWLLILTSFNFSAGLNRPGFYFYELLFMAVIASFLMLTPGPLTPYIFFISFFIFLLLASPAYNNFLNEAGFYPSFLFMIFSLFFVKLFILGALPPWISAPAASLCAVFICVRKSETIEYYSEEKNLIPAAAILYTALIIQCFLAAILKNPFFAG